MGIDRATGLFHWTPEDERRLAARVALLQSTDRPTYSRREASDAPVYGCEPCRDGDHSHLAFDIGPFLICRCLGCPDVVVEKVA